MKQSKVIIENTHKVPSGFWRKWSAEAKLAFNHIYSTVTESQDIYFATDIFPPKGKAKENVDKILNAGIWNMAVEAATYITKNKLK